MRPNPGKSRKVSGQFPESNCLCGDTERPFSLWRHREALLSVSLATQRNIPQIPERPGKFSFDVFCWIFFPRKVPESYPVGKMLLPKLIGHN